MLSSKIFLVVCSVKQFFFFALTEILMVLHVQTYRLPRVAEETASIKRSPISVSSVCVNGFTHIVINVGYSTLVISPRF